jgi:hypothetical protein
MDGGPGEDELFGGPGTDIMRAGDGDDSVEAVDRHADTVGVGRGADVVVADRHDTVNGGEGRDMLTGGRMSGGAGNDELTLRGGRRARDARPRRMASRCGPGEKDVVHDLHLADIVPASCEFVSAWFENWIAAPHRATGRRISISSGNPCVDSSERCRLDATLLLRGRVQSTVTRRWAEGSLAEARLSWTLSPAAARAARSGAPFTVRLVRFSGRKLRRSVTGFSFALR